LKVLDRRILVFALVHVLLNLRIADGWKVMAAEAYNVCVRPFDPPSTHVIMRRTSSKVVVRFVVQVCEAEHGRGVEETFYPARTTFFEHVTAIQ
jgi:hypothetical protein